MKAILAAVLALALGACQTDNLVTKQADDPRPTSVNPIAPLKGPQVAKGAVLFINGVDFRNLTHHIDEATPSIMYWFANGGFDVYRLDLAPKDQNPAPRLFAATDKAIEGLRRQSYRRVFVVGHSGGGIAALTSTTAGPIQSDGAIAFASGGVNALDSAEENLRFHRLLTSEIPANKRVAIFHFRDDELLGRWHREAVNISTSTLQGRKNAMVRVPPRATGHLATQSSALANIYGRCLAEFLAADDPNERVCPP